MRGGRDVSFPYDRDESIVFLSNANLDCLQSTQCPSSKTP